MAFHKTRDLNRKKEDIEKMMFNNFSIQEICDALEKDDLKVSTKSLRSFMSKFFPQYQDYLIRNGWSRKKKISPSLFDDSQKNGTSTSTIPDNEIENKTSDSGNPLTVKKEDITVNKSSPKKPNTDHSPLDDDEL